MAIKFIEISNSICHCFRDLQMKLDGDSQS